MLLHGLFVFFFFNDTATTEIYTLSLHDALPIYFREIASEFLRRGALLQLRGADPHALTAELRDAFARRSEEHTSELQSRSDLVCRLLLEKKKDAHMEALRDAPTPYRSLVS